MRGSFVVLACSVGAAIGLIFLAMGWNLLTTIAAAVVCGLCYAPIFPTAAGIASTYFPKIFGTIFLAAGCEYRPHFRQKIDST
jgi:hypothetical protein